METEGLNNFFICAGNLCFQYYKLTGNLNLQRKKRISNFDKRISIVISVDLRLIELSE